MLGQKRGNKDRAKRESLHALFTIQGDEAGPAGRRHDASPAQAAEQVSDDDDNNHEPRQHRDGQLPEALASLADQVGHGDPQETVHVVLPRDG